MYSHFVVGGRILMYRSTLLKFDREKMVLLGSEKLQLRSESDFKANLLI